MQIFKIEELLFFCKNTSLMSEEIERFKKEHDDFTIISKTSLLFFKIFAAYSRVVLQVFVFLGIGYLMGVETIFIDVVGFIKVILSTFMFTYFYASLSSFIEIKTKVSELMATFDHLFNLSNIFTSTAYD